VVDNYLEPTSPRHWYGLPQLWFPAMTEDNSNSVKQEKKSIRMKRSNKTYIQLQKKKITGKLSIGRTLEDRKWKNLCFQNSVTDPQPNHGLNLSKLKFSVHMKKVLAFSMTEIPNWKQENLEELEVIVQLILIYWKGIWLQGSCWWLWTSYECSAEKNNNRKKRNECCTLLLALSLPKEWKSTSTSVQKN